MERKSWFARSDSFTSNVLAFLLCELSILLRAAIIYKGMPVKMFFALENLLDMIVDGE